MNSKTPVLLSYAFRPFFLMNGVFAIFIVFAWVLTLHGKGLAMMTPLWHSHEMLIGFSMATVAGFSLTAVANWTGRPAVKGIPLALLAFSWLAGRLAMMLLGPLPAGLVFLLDTLFPALLFLLFGREVIIARNQRNYPLVAILFVVVLLNTLYHLGPGWIPGSDRLAIHHHRGSDCASIYR
jgi:uncharacterized protein involved in response to NO